MLSVLLVAGVAFGQQEQEEVWVPMRDGTLLHTMLNFPLNTPRENLPAVMDRSPYGQTGIELIADLFVPLGYVGVRQDVRGTGKSEGYFNWFQNEGDDSTDTNNWIIAQNWSNGVVDQTGASADGICTFISAGTAPKMLQAQYIIWSSAVGYPIIYPQGAYKEYLTNHWASSTVKSNGTWLINDMESHEQPGAWWDALNMTNNYDVVDWPSVFWAGWYDIFLSGNLISFDGYQTQSQVPGKSRLVVDPCGHCQDAADWFPENLVLGRSLLPITLAYDLFNNTEPYNPNILAITWYVMGANAHDYPNAPGNYWTSLDDWPAATPTAFYLNADSGSNLLTASPPSTGGQQTYTYDPTDPVPTLCGSNLFLDCGPCDQTSTEQGARSDVLTFTSVNLTEPLVVTGAMDAVLYVSSDQLDTDFMVKVTDVYPTGESILLQDNAYRMRWRNVYTAENMTQGQIYEIELSLWNTSYVFDVNHAVRVDISSSNYPRFSVNPNSGWALNTTSPGPLYTAKNTIYASSQYPSRLILPVTSLDKMPEIPLEAIRKEADMRLGRSKVDELLKEPLAERYLQTIPGL